MSNKGVLIKGAELVEVTYSEDNKKVTLTFLDHEAGEIREVNFNKQVYKDGKYVDSEEKAKAAEEWCREYFGKKFEKLSDCIGMKKDVWAYPTFSSLSEVDMVEKFTKEMKGKIYQTEIKSIEVDDLFIRVAYDIDGATYETKYKLSTWVPSMQKYFPDPVKRAKELKRFEEKFGMSVEEKDFLIGEKIIVEVSVAFGQFYYGDIKDRA